MVWDYISEWFEDFEINPVAALLAVGMMVVLVYAFFNSPDQETVNTIPLFYRIISLPIAGGFGYWLADKLLNR